MKISPIFAGMLACGILICTLGAGCITPDDTPSPPPAEPPLTPAAAEDVVSANNRFAYDLYHTLAADEVAPGENIFFSPFSISTALSLAGEGAKGVTADEIFAVLHLPDDTTTRQEGFSSLITALNRPDAAYTLQTANALWAEQTYPFLPAYIDTAERYYAAEVRNLDFIGAPEASRQTINLWVANETAGKIAELIPKGVIDSLTRLVITNAIYFKGTWVLQFDVNETKEAPFDTGTGTPVMVDMMERTDEDAWYAYGETDDLQLLRMPYANESGQSLSMLVLLPKGTDIAAAEAALGTDALAETIVEMEERKVRVFFPKFSMDLSYSLPKTLAAMGMPTAFSGNADFSGMDGKGNLYISDVIHQATVDVTEEGTEAAAATAVVMRLTSVEEPVPPVVFRADHPFVFQIEDDDTGAVLFIGRVADPMA